MSFAAYKRTLEDNESPRQIERRVLARLTAQIEQFSGDFDSTRDGAARLAILSSDLGRLLWENQKIWQSFMSDVAEPENALPGALKAGILSLGHWVERHTELVVRGTGDLAPLLSVNHSIIAGLAGQSERPAAAVAGPAQDQGADTRWA